MACYDKDEVPMLSDIHPQPSENNQDSQFQALFSRTQSASISIPMNSIESYESTNLVGHTGPLRNERKIPFIQMSGPLYISRKPENSFHPNQSVAGHKMVESKAEKFPSFNGVDEKDWSDNNYVGKNEHLLRSGQLGMCNDPYCTTCPTYYNFKADQEKNSKASGIFDTKFHNVLYGDAKGWARRLMSFLSSYVPGVMNPHAKVVQQWNQFFVISCLMAVFIDPLFFFLLSVQKDNKCIVINQPATKAFVVLRSMTDFIYLLNMLLQFRLAYIAPESRVVGAGELVDHPKKIAVNYLSRYFFLDLFVVLPLPQRVNQCLRNACHDSNILNCEEFIDCGYGHTSNRTELPSWKNNANASACFSEDGFPYGIYIQTVNLTTERSIITRYVYSLFWGFQQISTLAGNQTPSYFVWEVLFTMAIVGLGLLLFALLIGNMQNFLQALGRRRLEMSLRRRDVEQWMSHRRLPEELRRKVREAERYNWAATRGVNEEMLFENLPEDLQRDIRRHLFKFVKKVRIFALMDDPILDAICERLRQKTYIKGSKVLSRGSLIEKMVFIVRGKMESVGENGVIDPLCEGDVCGEELLTWCLEHSSVNRDGKKIRIPGQRLLSNRIVRCLTNVEAFSLRAADLEEVTCLFSRFLRNPRVQGAIRYESRYWRSLAATHIQVAWRYRKKRLNRADTSQSGQSSR
ncbi:PREDICTED: probable cyclic nucleotide-gated ion channel 20, chloroplastic isoform X3 [Theobroma cacao]|uniref:Probable cyclic nucleotide-gated ion channel 20, chloroplastic isoform X3 n=1 Tax=Theobroma cacao TaxID=3641 RepID=A0AB32UMJ0_THECC|nr:PREDICTED: probable cyclic nucleotide-gated ion channel 20, chloroplastic isoform X3 [Theobroma cacao]